MKKLIQGALLSIGLLAGTTQAAMIVDTVAQNEHIDWWESYSYTHNLNDDGFALGSALSGTLEILVRDDKKGWDEFLGWESILFVVEDFDFDTGDISFFGSAFSNELEVEALASINADGYLGVKVTSVLGDFWLGDSVLTVQTADVPGPGILGLMAIGMIGLGFSRRKRQI